MLVHNLRRGTWLSVFIGLSATWQLGMAASDTGTLLVAQKAGVCGGGVILYDGYVSVFSIGSYSPTGLTGGKTVDSVADELATCTPTISISFLAIDGFSANPGQSWLTSATCNGVTNNGSAATYSYSSGIAQWVWSTKFNLSSENGMNVSCTIVHN